MNWKSLIWWDYPTFAPLENPLHPQMLSESAMCSPVVEATRGDRSGIEAIRLASYSRFLCTRKIILLDLRPKERWKGSQTPVLSPYHGHRWEFRWSASGEYIIISSKNYLLPDSCVFGESVKHQRLLAQLPSTFGRTETVENMMEQFS